MRFLIIISLLLLASCGHKTDLKLPKPDAAATKIEASN